MRTVLLIAAGVFAAAINAQTQVQSYGSDKSQVEGIAYTLPKHQIVLRVRAQRTEYSPGQYNRYAEEFLKISDVIVEPRTEWTLLDIESTIEALPDSLKAYFIKVAEKTVAPNVYLSDDGMLLAINEEPAAMETLPVARAVLNKPAEDTKPLRNPSEYYTSDIIQASSPLTMARLIASEISEVRENRNELLRGELDNMPKDAGSMQLIISEMKAQEDALLSLFIGTTRVSTEEFTFIVSPDNEIEEQILFRFSQKLGVLDADDLAGAPFHFSLRSRHTLPDKAPLSDAELKRADKLRKDNEKRQMKGEPYLMEGVIYNVPERAVFEISSQGRSLLSTEYRIAQLGTTDVLINDLFNKRNTFHVRFNPHDGALLKVHQSEPSRK